MAALALAFDILARDRASAEFNKVGDAADGAAKKGAAFGKVVGGAVVAGVAALGAVVKTGFGEVMDYQAGLAQLEAGIKSTGGAAGVTAPQLEELASKIQNYSGQTDDSIVASEKLLLTFTNIKNSGADKIFDAATVATADLAARMGGDASGAAIQLGKALNDPIKGVSALQRIGISFTDSQKATIASMMKAGDVAGAQKIILAELNKEVGGSAEAYGKTLPGQVDLAKRKFEDTSQALVTALLPAMSSLLTVGGEVIAWAQRNTAVLGPLASVLGAGAAAYLVVTKAIAATNIVLAAFRVGAAESGTAMTVALGPIGLVIIAIAALAAGLIYAYKHSETFRNVVKAAFDKVTEAVGFFIDKTADLFSMLGHIPGFGWAKTAAEAMHGAADAARRLGDEVNGIPKVTNILINVIRREESQDVASAKQAAAGHRALGGPVQAGVPYTVGEFGPERFVPASAGVILTADQTAGLGSSGPVVAALARVEARLASLPRDYQLGVRARYGV